MLKTGMIIAERYEILGKIGTGGMADVYKAKDHKLNRFVAVKVLKPEFREDTTFIRKFRSEAQAAAGLTHPNIVNVFDVGDDGGVYYIVMELIEGITLKEYIAKKGKLSIKEATSIAIQVSMGLEAAHNHGIVHRDVKPQNIIISTDGKVKVTDFGIARAASSNTISSNVMGSVHYSSPEQVRGGYSDEKSDIYSLGITLYEMVTGRVPFDGDTTVAIAIKHLQEEMVPPSVYTENLPYSLEQIILKCTQKSVGRRYEKMEDVIADLKHSLIDPQGNFVTLSSVDNEAKTVVISDEELGEIKSTPRTSAHKPEVDDLEEEIYDTDYDDADNDYEEVPRRKKSGKKKKSSGSAVTIAALVAGAVVLVGAIFAIGKAAGIIGNDDTAADQQTEQSAEPASEEDGMVAVPDLVGKTEDEAAALLEEEKLGKQMMGEENSTQEKGRISSQDIPAGTKVEQYTTIKYYISKGQQAITVPELSGQTGVDAQQTLEDLGLVVTVQKEYSEADDTGWPLTEPGYVMSVSPEAGTSMTSGASVTLTVSRGLDHGDTAQIPNVVGMTKNEAITALGKWTDIQITEEQSTEVPAGQVISQDPSAVSDDGDTAYGDPDTPMYLVISSGNQAPTAETSETAEGNTGSDNAADIAQQSAAAANGEIWKCTQTLNTPNGYQGGAIRLELIQEVNGESESTKVVDGQAVEFPYTLDITGAPGVSTGTLWVSELINGNFQQLGSYPLTFKKAE